MSLPLIAVANVCGALGLLPMLLFHLFFFFQAEDGIRDYKVTGVQTCALPISMNEKHVAPIGILSPEITLGSYDLAHVPDQRIGVPVSRAGDAEHMRNPVHMEGDRKSVV